MARKDIWLWHDGSAWVVGARHGDGDTEVWRRSFDRESVARVLVETMIKRNGGRDAWLDLTNLALGFSAAEVIALGDHSSAPSP
jgi:hypothetical protein